VIRVLHAEWTKARTVPGTYWLLAATVALIPAVGAAAVATTDVRDCPVPGACAVDVTKLSLTGVLVAQVAVVVLAVLMVGNEYGTGLIRVTLTAVPARLALFAGKLIVLSGLVAAGGSAGVTAAVEAARAIGPGAGLPPLSWSAGPTMRAATGTLVYLALIALLAAGVAAIVRDTAGALITVLAALFVAPIVAAVISNPVWHRRLEKYAPMTAGLSVQSGHDVAHPWSGIVVLAAYAAGAVLLGGMLLSVRDA
jgi:hypothetical protein